MSTGVHIALTENVVFLQDAVGATNQARRAERQQRREARERSRSRSRAYSPSRSPPAASGFAAIALAGTTMPTRRLSMPDSYLDEAATPMPGSPVDTPRGGSRERTAGDETPPARPPPAVLRGLLTLTLNKPSKVRKITLRFKGVSRTEWPEGIGPRRLEISEDTSLINTTFPIFSATQPAAPSLRRANSHEAVSRAEEQYVRQGRGLARASSVMPGREASVDSASYSYYSSRDATGPSTNAVAGPSRHTLDTPVNGDMPFVSTPEDEPPAFMSIANGHQSAPVPSSSRSSIDGASREARPAAQTRIGSSSRGAGVDHTKQTRFNLPSLLKGKDKAAPETNGSTPASARRDESPARARSRSRGRQMNLKAIKDALVSTVGEGKADDSDDEDEGGQHNWREFKAGRYVWPIQMPVPVTLPPTLDASFGSIRYTLKATVKRVGALTPNLTSWTSVELVSSPGQDDTDDTESLVIERMWDYQMRYLVTLSGKAFPVGGKIPISIRLNPLAKVKLYRISALIEENMSYYAHDRRIARHEGVHRFQLCKIEWPVEEDVIWPLLPVTSERADALLGSPLTPWIIHPTSNDDYAAALLDPIGPWELETELQLPDCKSRMHFSCKHPKGNIEASHTFKLTLRVERGDREFLDTKGQPKKFDIVIEAPITLLSCRNATNLLPAYSSDAMGLASSSVNGSCTCPTAASGDALDRQRQFARLVAGVESETGEIPPTYGWAVSHPSEGEDASPPTSPPTRNTNSSSPAASPRQRTSDLPSLASRGRAPSSTGDSRSASRGRLASRLTRSLSRAPAET